MDYFNKLNGVDYRVNTIIKGIIINYTIIKDTTILKGIIIMGITITMGIIIKATVD